MSIHKKKANGSPDKKEKMEVRKYLPVNHFITNNNININIYNNITIASPPETKSAYVDTKETLKTFNTN